MLARILIVIGFFAFLPFAQGQQIMGNSCPFPFQMAPNAFNPNDGKTVLQRRMDNAKAEMERLEKRIKPIASRVEKEELAIRHRIDGDAGEAVIDHIEGNADPDVRCRFDEYQEPPPEYYPPQGPTRAVPDGGLPPPPKSSLDKPYANRMPAADTLGSPTPAPSPSPSPSSTPKATPSPSPSKTEKDNNVKKTEMDPDPKDKTAKKVEEKKEKTLPDAENTQPAKISDESRAPVRRRVDPESYDGYGSAAGPNGSRFCVANGIDHRPHDFWAEWTRGDGDISPEACTSTVNGIHVPGTYSNGRIKSECVRALRKLKTDYAELRDLKQKYEKVEGDYEEFKDKVDEQTEAGASVSSAPGSMNGMQQFMQFMQMLSATHNGGYSGYQGPGQFVMGQPHPEFLPIPPQGIGGWPMPPTSQFAPFNYQSVNPGLMNNNFGCYGCVTGSIGQGAFGCQGMNNPLLYGNPNQFGGPGGFRPPYGPWQNGAPYSLPLPHPGVLPMPGGGFRPMVGGPAPGGYGAVPYLNSNFGGGLPYGAGVGGVYPVGTMPYAGTGVLPTYTGPGSIYAGGVGTGLYSGLGTGNGYAPGSIRPYMGGSSMVGTGYYGGGYATPGSAVPPILQPTSILGAGATTSPGGGPSQLPLGPYKSN